MVQEKGKALLNQKDLGLLMYLIHQYRKRALPIEDLVHSLSKLFDNEEKESLFTEIDELIFNEDLGKYDSLVFQKGKLFERVMEAIKPRNEIDQQELDQHQFDKYEGSDYVESDEDPKCISWTPKIPESVRKCTRSFSLNEDTEPLLNRKVTFAFDLNLK